MKLPNGYGSVTKLSGARRKPYMVRVTADLVYDPVKDDYVQKRMVLGYYAKKSEALEALAAYNKNPNGVLESGMTISELWETVKKDIDTSKDRMRAYESVFKKYFQGISGMAIKNVKTRQLQKCIDDCDKGPATKTTIKTVMNRIFEYAVQNDIVDRNYAEYVRFKQEETDFEREIYTDEEVRKMWDNSDLECYAITLILVHQGMRIKEFLDLKKEDVDLEKRTLVIKQAKNAYSIRTIPINPHVIELFERLCRTSGDHLTELNRAAYASFVRNTLHHKAYDCRHTFATKCHELGMKTLVIQRIMGHKPDTLLEQVYTHLSMEELAENMALVTYR